MGLKIVLRSDWKKIFQFLLQKTMRQFQKIIIHLEMQDFCHQLILPADITGHQTTQPTICDGTQTTSTEYNYYCVNAAVSLDWTIFNGFNAQTTYKKLDELNQVGPLNTQLSVENLISDIVVGYYNYILQMQVLNNLKYAASLSRERLENR